ncbi:MAG: glycosyltransferase family 4 protein [Niveispirillum sp.]|uniref:glycosyltransferase family 4 protein n=1 Tax=Niveispirillum sp. TaxID=1917217 RepID=UPI003BA5985E
MRVVISTIGRFHSLNQGRQLQARGALAALFTGYPRFKLADSGIDPALLRTWPWIQAPYMGLLRFPGFQRHLATDWSWWAQSLHDRHVAAHLPPCDAVIALSGMGLRTGRVAQARGGRHVCDRGSSHIGYQDDILREEYGRQGFVWQGIDPRVKARELAEYDSADAITVPSGFVRDSFITRGVPADKLILVPYGGDLSRFRPLGEKDRDFRILFVGQLAIRKGLSYLLQAVRRAALPGAKLVLAGLEQPETATLLARETGLPVERLGVLRGDDLVREMSRASVLVLPSVEEGLAMVMAEALACGTPVIASTNTGAADLFSDGVEGFILPIRDPDAIADRLTRLAADPGLRAQMGHAARDRIQGFGGWDRYGDRLYTALRTLTGA